MAVTITLSELSGFLAGGAASSETGNRRSEVVATVTGASGTVIPVHSRARSVRADVWRSQVPVTIPASGHANVTFESVEFGAIFMQVGELTEIVDVVPGWSTMTNRQPVTLGEYDYVPMFFDAAVAAILRYAPTAPDAIHNRAVTMLTGYWASPLSDNTAISRNLDGDRDIWSDTTRASNGLRFSGAMALLSPWKRRRALG